MARKKISEFTAKLLLSGGLAEIGLQLPEIHKLSNYPEGKSELRSFIESQSKTGSKTASWVLKVDQGIKKRGKLGLLELNCDLAKLIKAWQRLTKLGYEQFIVEPFLPHADDTERYISWERVRGGWQVLFSAAGGIEVEEQGGKMHKLLLTHSEQLPEIVQQLNLPAELGLNFLKKTTELFDSLAIAFAEINPLVVENGQLQLQDLAVEVDSAGEFLAERQWTDKNFVEVTSAARTTQELAIRQLDAKSQASLKFELLNPDGKIWLLLSGGGASIVLADEFYNMGLGQNLANYGEYSGNPSAEETYIYTKNIVQLLLESKSQDKVIIIAGGVANFTDIRITFKGIIKALEEYAPKLNKQQVKVYVRRGGPFQTEGLASMEAFLARYELLGIVSGPSMPLTEIAHLC